MNLRRLLTILFATLVVAATVAMPARADGSDSERLTYLVTRGFEGALTPAEFQELVSNYPAAAEAIPARTAEDGVSVSSAMSARMAVASSGCATIFGTRTQKSITTLTTLYVFKHYVNFCWNGTTVTSVTPHAHRMESVDWTIGSWTVQSATQSGVNTATAKSYKQLNVTHCFPPAGCVGKSYPWVDITMKRDGSSSYANGG